MATPRPQTTLSSKGQVVLPSATRRAMGWTAGERLTVEQQGDTIILRRASPFKPTKPEDVFGSARYDGPPVSIEDMNKAIETMVQERHERGRY